MNRKDVLQQAEKWQQKERDMSEAIEAAIWSACDEGTFSHGSNPQEIVGDMVKAVEAALADLISKPASNAVGQ